MSEEEVEKPIKTKGTFRRWLLMASATLGILLLIVVGATLFAFRLGYVDNYIKEALINSFAEYGIKTEIGKLSTTVFPTTATLENVVFLDEKTNDKLAKIDRLNIDLTISNILALRAKRKVSVDSTDVDGLEVWVKFDENGRSNFSNLNFKADESEPNLQISVASMNFSLKNALIHYGDVSRKLSGDAKNVTITVEPENILVPEDERRYKFNLTSDNSVFVYDDKPIEPINISATGVADKNGAEIESLSIKTPIGESSLSGTVKNWELPNYNFKIYSTIDLTQTSTILPSGTALRGIGNFEGTVTGEGEKYQIIGEVDSESLVAANIRLKGVVVNADIKGENAIYEGNGKAIAELLTFEDFQIDFPQLVGNVRGNGTDFKWFGELQAAAAKSPDGSLAGLFISDAVAEYKDKQFSASLGRIRAGRLVTQDLIAESLQVSNAKFSLNNGTVNVSAPNVQANLVKVEGTEIKGVNANDIKVTNRDGKTDVDVNNAQAESLRTKDANLRNIKANQVKVTNQNGATDIVAQNVQADGVDTKEAKIGNLQAGNINVKVRGKQTDVVSETVKIAKIETDAAVLGSLNIAGVRLKIVQGRIEGTSNDIDAGNIDLRQNGKIENAKIYKPVFVLEPSGRYRASMDMSLGGGVLGSVKLGAARASVVADNDKVALNNLNAEVMDGKVTGNAVIAMNQRSLSKVNAEFTELDLSKLVALQGGRVIPITGKTTGKADLYFQGTNFKAVNGTLTADFDANAGSEDRGLVPINGRIGLNATNGLFDIDYAKLNTAKSEFEATGRFDLNGDNSNLNLALNSTDATEIERLIRVLNLSPELEQQLDDYQASVAGNLRIKGNLTGNLENPILDGNASLESLILRGRNLGSLSTNIFLSPETIDLRDGVLQENNGGKIDFAVNIPRQGENNISVDATLTRVNTGKLIAALPIKQSLPEQLQDFNATTSGRVELKGLPENMDGIAKLSAGSGTVAGQKFDGFEADAIFSGKLITLNQFALRFADGVLNANGTYQTDTTTFNFHLEGKGLQAASFRPFITESESVPDFSGKIDLVADARGNSNDLKTFNVEFGGTGQDILIDGKSLGTVNFKGKTTDQKLNADLVVNFEGQQQLITGSLDFGNENLPFRVNTDFNKADLAPYIALANIPDGVALTGKVTGKVFAEGNLYAKDANGEWKFTTDNIKGKASFSEFGIEVNETPFQAIEPLVVSFSPHQILVENGKFAGGGSNVSVNGAVALDNKGTSNLTVNGKVNLRVFAIFTRNVILGGLTDLSVRVAGVGTNARLTGSAQLENVSFSTFIGNDRINLTAINGRLLFTSNQVQIDRLDGKLGGGKIVASGGAVLSGLNLERFRFDIDGQNVTAPLMDGFIATADTDIEVTGFRESASKFNTRIAGNVLVRRAAYTKDIDLADIVSSRRTGGASGGGDSSFFGIPQIDLNINGRDSIIVRNNIADVRASANLRVTGDFKNPVISGRLTANQGTVFFRNDRYEIQRGFLEFPPDSNNEPVVNLQAETDIQGYQVIVSLVGSLSDTENLNATVRSSPALPQADVISLITTGNLSNASGGIPTLAQSGINTAAEVITDSLINEPIRRATDKLFGLNKFEIDPLISGRRLSPSARLTVGRQINRNLAVTYSTNLSEDQNQVIALEYRVSNRISFVAQYEQRSLSNVTRNNNNFSFEVRLRRRF